GGLRRPLRQPSPLATGGLRRPLRQPSPPARRLFLNAALLRSFLELLHHRPKRHSPRADEDKQVIENVGRLRPDRTLLERCRGDGEFDRLFAEFAGAMRRALGEQARGVGRLRTRARTLIDRAREFVEREHRGTVLLAHRVLISRYRSARNRTGRLVRRELLDLGLGRAL